jgi:glutamate racemase
VRAFSEAITRFLLGQGAKVIVVACNAASAAALHHLRDRFPQVPFVGMEPAVKPAIEHTRNGVVGVIATQATFQGELFASLMERYGGGVEVVTQVGKGLVEAVEAGALDAPETLALVHACLDPLLAAGIDQLVLGCTHYPLLRPLIDGVVGPEVDVIDPAPAVARQVARVLESRGLAAAPGGSPQHVFYSTAAPAPFAEMLSCLPLTTVPDVRSACWQAGVLQVC